LKNDGGRRRRPEIRARRLARWSSLSSIHILAPAGEDRLVLRAHNLVRGFSIGFLLVALLILLGGVEISALDESNARTVRLLVGGFFLLLGAGMWLAPGRTVFDRREGTLSQRNWFFTFSCPSKEIVAIQIIYGRRHGSPYSTGYKSRQLDLVLNNPDVRRVHLTNHSSDEAGARLMATEISEFLNVPVWDAIQGEETRQAAGDQGEDAAAPYSKRVAWLVWLARACYLGAFATAFFCVVAVLQQARLDEFEASIRPVRARLIAKEVKEWIEGHDNWAAIGTFQIESGEYQGRAEGNFIPLSYYETHRLRRRHRPVTRDKAETFLAGWEIGQEYDGYIYPDAKDRIFFELPGAEKNARMAWRLGITSAVFFTLGVVASGYVSYRTRPRSAVQ
jgi:hypothetical protein